LKRSFDIGVSLVALIILSIPLVLFSAIIALRMGRPVIFRQNRPGRGGKSFEMIKFRTMNDARNAQGQLLPDSQRLTPFGCWIRAASIDELPELWNVLKGEMSLVGPRPLLTEYLELYTPEQARRHEVRPGITGWAQINGRNALSWEEKFKLDVWYVDNYSILLDFKIIWLTVKKVLLREGINATGEVTMPRFTGKAQSRKQ